MIKLVLFYYVLFLALYSLSNFERIEKPGQKNSLTSLYEQVFTETELLSSGTIGWDCKQIKEFKVASNNIYGCFEEVRYYVKCSLCAVFICIKKLRTWEFICT